MASITELQPPSARQRSRELRFGLDVVRSIARAPGLRSLPRGQGDPVVIVAGLGAGDRALTPLRQFLRQLGHDARPARLGRISDDVEELFPTLGRACTEIAEETGRRVTLIGWSIGGVLAREAARDDAESIARVITFGTPVEGGPSYTSLAWRYGEDELAEVRRRIDERSASPIDVPVTAIWSPNDGIVSPDACIDRRTPGVEHVEVTGTHVGMSIDHDVWSVIARRLAVSTDQHVSVAS